MVKGSAFIFLFALAILALPFLYLTSFASLVSTSGYVMEVQSTLFAFGWSAITGEKWLVKGELIILNPEALVVPPSVPIEDDAGPRQTNPSIIYTNNIGFNYGWGTNASERYRPSTSMNVGATQAFNNKGILEPLHTPIYEDAGPKQTNPSIIYFNNIGFHSSWSSNATERYRPSNSMAVGPLTVFNSKGPMPPPIAPISEDAGSSQTNPSFIYLNNIGFHFAWSPQSQDKYRPSTSMAAGPLTSPDNKSPVNPQNTPIYEDAGPAQTNPSVIYLNNIGFHFGWSPNNEDKYRPSTSMSIGSLATLNTKALVIPPDDAVDHTPPMIDIPMRNPAEDPTPQQNVTISVNVTDYGSGVKQVILTYNINNTSTWTNITMTPVIENLYQAEIHGQPYCTNVTYKIIAYDYQGNFAIKSDEPYEIFHYHVVSEFSSIILALSLIITTIIVLSAKRKMLIRN